MADVLALDAARVARMALDEDGDRDITSDVAVPRGLVARGAVVQRQQGVVAGQVYAEAVARAAGLAPPRWVVRNGEVAGQGTVLGEVRGDLAALLRAERPMLNLLQRAGGIATLTRQFVSAVEGTGCRILHTRKTVPGLRHLDVEAVIAGGGQRHRMDLAHAVMIKDNHWQALDEGHRSLADVLAAARRLGVTVLHVEVETLPQLDLACAAGATRLLIDNQDAGTIADWSARARALRPGIEIEATGGITLDRVRQVADTGVDFVSIGALTHSVAALDIALEIML